MAKHLIKMADGGVGIMTTTQQWAYDPVENVLIVDRIPTPDECLAKWHPDSLANVLSHEPIDEADIPTDRYFRDAWKHDLSVDMTKAVEIHKDKIRALRAPLLADSDIQFMRALQSGDTKAQAEIAAKAKALRDVTDDPAIALAQTPEQLKAAVPDILKN